MVAQAVSPVLPLDGAQTDVVEQPEGFTLCPACHTADTALTNASLATGGYWQCGRCGSKWDQRRLATVAAYAAWDLSRQAPALKPVLVPAA
jgi:hypothetical protein